MEEKQKIKDFTDLKVKLVLETFKAVEKFPQFENYTLGDRKRRSSVSVTINIAVGFGRHSYKEKLQFYYPAQASLTEPKNQLLVARNVGYLEYSV